MRTIVLLSAVLALAAGLKCYAGIYQKGKAPSSSDFTDQCSKTCIKTKLSASGTETTTYSCGDGACDSISNGKCKKQKDSGGSATMCCCTGDLCNSSGLAQISAAVVLVLSALVM